MYITLNTTFTRQTYLPTSVADWEWRKKEKERERKKTERKKERLTKEWRDSN